MSASASVDAKARRHLDLAHRIKEMTKSSSPISLIPYEQAYGKGFEDIRNRVPDLTRINALIGYRPERDLTRILQDTIEDIQRRIDAGAGSAS